MGEMHLGQGCWASMLSLNTPPSPDSPVFPTQSGASLNLAHLSFLWRFHSFGLNPTTGHWRWNSISSPSCLLGGWGVGLKVPTF